MAGERKSSRSDAGPSAAPGAASGRRTALLCGGLGGARLAPALRLQLMPNLLTVIANVGDDLEWMGLAVSPDVDSVAYALAGLWDEGRGWGRRGETFRVRDELARRGGAAWFGVGDLDLAWHLERRRRRQSGQSAAQAIGEMLRAAGVSEVSLVPAGEAADGTRVLLGDGRALGFQEWYVRERAEPAVRGVVFADGVASPQALQALGAAEIGVLGPSNPVSSIGAILALGGMREAFAAVPLRVAVSPVVLGRRIESATIEHHDRARQRLLAAEGGEDRPGAIARRYAGLAEYFLLDESDAAEAEAVERAGLRPVLGDLLDARRLADRIIALGSVLPRRA